MYISTGTVQEALAKQVVEKPENVSPKQSQSVSVEQQDFRPFAIAATRASIADTFLVANAAVNDATPQPATELKVFASQLPKTSNISNPGDDQYTQDIYHWATSSTQPSICTVQPGTAEDVSSILKFIDQYRKPDGSRIEFGVKSGGHTGNPGFSSTSGILISMSRFNQVTYQPETQTAVIGAGQIWDHVYEQLAEHNVNVLGARVTHIGVAGFILGGGYSWKTNQYGLAIDTVTAFELVKPDGTIVNVTEASDPDLFFGLRGGGNNFGIVTNFTLKTFPQSNVWGGPLLLMNLFNNDDVEEQMKKLFFAAQTFIDTVTDPKAALLVSLGTLSHWIKNVKIINVIAFYDGPSPPAGTFDMFQQIAPDETAENWKERSFLDLVQSGMDYDQSSNYRGTFHTVGLSKYTPELLEKIWQRNDYWHSNTSDSRYLLTYSVEPFLPDILSKGAASAYPPDRSVAYSPFPIYVSWEDAEFDTQLHEFAKKATKEIEDAAAEHGIATGARYSNYAITDTPLEEIYGKNVERLKQIKASVDPKNIMGQAGGFKF